MELEIHLLMCCSHDGVRPCMNSNLEPAHRETLRMSMSRSLTSAECCCHLVVLTCTSFPSSSPVSSTSDLGPKGRKSETSVTEMQSHRDIGPCGPNSRAVVPSISAEQPLSNYSGEQRERESITQCIKLDPIPAL